MVTASVSARALQKFDCLSKRELEVATGIAYGHRAADIAEELGIDVKTVHSYRSRVLLKLQATGSARVAILAYVAGIIDIEI